MAMEENSNVYPNIEGDRIKSFNAIGELSLPMDSWNYSYIPGLREGDPNDLVLFYMNEKTRYKAHFDRPILLVSLMRKPQWMVIAPGFPRGDMSDPQEGLESGRLEDTPVFISRLKKTIDYLEENNRPNWQQVKKEYLKIIEEIKKNDI